MTVVQPTHRQVYPTKNGGSGRRLSFVPSAPISSLPIIMATYGADEGEDYNDVIATYKNISGR
jgi:hypothetical protein